MSAEEVFRRLAAGQSLAAILAEADWRDNLVEPILCLPPFTDDDGEVLLVRPLLEATSCGS